MRSLKHLKYAFEVLEKNSADFYLKTDGATYLVAVDANHKSTFFADPVVVEKRSFAYVTHFTNTLHDSFPSNSLICKNLNLEF